MVRRAAWAGCTSPRQVAEQEGKEVANATSFFSLLALPVSRYPLSVARFSATPNPSLGEIGLCHRSPARSNGMLHLAATTNVGRASIETKKNRATGHRKQAAGNGKRETGDAFFSLPDLTSFPSTAILPKQSKYHVVICRVLQPR